MQLDTHANEAEILTRKIAGLDAGLKAFHRPVGLMWDRTVIIVATEFGPTVRPHRAHGLQHAAQPLGLGKARAQRPFNRAMMIVRAESDARLTPIDEALVCTSPACLGLA